MKSSRLRAEVRATAKEGQASVAELLPRPLPTERDRPLVREAGAPGRARGQGHGRPPNLGPGHLPNPCLARLQDQNLDLNLDPSRGRGQGRPRGLGKALRGAHPVPGPGRHRGPDRGRPRGPDQDQPQTVGAAQALPPPPQTESNSVLLECN